MGEASDAFIIAVVRTALQAYIAGDYLCANVLLDAPGFSAVIVATNGSMARMNTVAPGTFVAFKRWLAAQRDRDALKRRSDELQADAVQRLVEDYLPAAPANVPINPSSAAS